MKLPTGMSPRSLLLILLAMCGSACSRPDPACQAILAHGDELETRVPLPLGAKTPDGVPDPNRSLTPAAAERLLRQARLLRSDLPASARDQNLDVIIRKLGARRSAFEQALQDFLAIDPTRLDGGLESSATMPIRRGVVMSRNEMVSLLSTAIDWCKARE